MRKMKSLIFHPHTNHRMLIQLQLTLQHLKLTLLPVDMHIPLLPRQHTLLLEWHHTLLHQEMQPTHLQMDKGPTGALQLILLKHNIRRKQQKYSI